ncbi:MAG: hypothetical protein ACO1RX_06820 [Candidatus Sericytochromatia bacterium]
MIKRYLALASTASLLMVSCQPPQQVRVDVFRIEGDVMVPQQDQSIQPERQAFDPSRLLMGDAQAATGLKPAVAGVQVRLLRIDNEGSPVSNEPLVITRTDANGHYVMDIPTEQVSLPATNLVIEVGNYATGAYLRNFAIQERVDLNPVTTALVQLMVDRNEPLLSLPVNVLKEAATLSEQGTQAVDYSSVNLNNALTNTLSSLKSNATLSARLDQLLTRVVSGKVLAPNGRIAAAPQLRLDEFFVPPAEALVGLQAVSSDITVTLSKIDNNGNVVGLPLAVTKTQSDGSYSIILPPEAQLTSEYTVSVGSGPSLMRSMLSGSSQLDISPLSEMTTRLILDNGTILSQPRIPITEFSPLEINAILDAVQRSTANTTLGGAGTVSAVLSVIDPVAKNDSVVRNNLSAAGGIPGPAVNPIAPVISEDTITLTGTARAGSLVTVEGGTQSVSQSLASGESSFSIVVPLKRNSNHALGVRAVVGGEASLATVVNIRTDTLNPRIVADKIIARNPNGTSFETIITGSTGAIEDMGRATLLISGPKLGNTTQIQTNESGAFEARLAADSGDVLNITAVDEANNRSESQIVVGGPGPVVTTVLQESTIIREAPFADRVITIQGAGFDPVLGNNVVSFTSPVGNVTSTPRSISTDRRTLVVPVPEGLVAKLSDLPSEVTVQVTTGGIPSNDNRSFKLFPKLQALTQTRLSGNGLSEFLHLDATRQNILMTSQLGSASSILALDTNGNVLSRDIAEDITHDSVFRDLTIDSNGNLLTSNFDALLAGKPRELPDVRPTFRVSHYRLQGTGAELEMTQRVAESADLGSEPGAIAFSPSTNKIYVALPSEGRIVKIDFTGGQFSRPETLVSGLPTPIRDVELDTDGRFMYISLGQNIAVFRLTLNAQGDVDLLNSNFATNMGNGNGRLTVDADRNLYLSLGTGIERINERGQRLNLVPILDGLQPTVGVVHVNGQLYVNQLNRPDLFRISR